MVARTIVSPALERACGFLVALVNTERASSRNKSDELKSPEDMRALLIAHHFDGIPESLEHSDLLEVQSMRSRLDLACRSDDIADCAETLNDLMVRVHAVPSLCQHDGIPWHVHYTQDGMSIAQRIAAYAGMGLVQLIAAGQHDRLSECAAPDCSRLFLDLSKNKSRMYCDSRLCGNRLHASAYRTRQTSRTG